jgi:hypothetical protein
MNFFERLKEMMLAIGKEVDIPIEIADQNIVVAYDEFNECSVAAVNHDEAVEFRAPLFAFAPENRDELFEEALKLNLYGSGGAVAALSDHAPVLLLRDTVAAQGLHQQELGQALAGFVETVRSVRKRLLSARGNVPSEKDDPRLEVYKVVNPELRAQNGRMGELSPEVDHLTRAATHFMSKLPDFHGIVARGGGSGWQDIAREKYVPGQVVTEYAFNSGSPDRGFDGSIPFIIESRHGKEVTDLSVTAKDGREVLFPPGAKFEVLAVQTGTEDFTIDSLGVKKGNPNNEKTMFIIMREVD